MSHPTSTTWTFPDAPPWLPIAMLAATLALEGLDLYRTRPVATITPQDCWALCSWSGSRVSAWSEQRCECNAVPTHTETTP